MLYEKKQQFRKNCLIFSMVRIFLTFYILVCLNLVERAIRLEKTSNQRQEFTVLYVYCSLYLMQCKTCPNICKGWSLTVDPLCGKLYRSTEWKLLFSSRALNNGVFKLEQSVGSIDGWKYRGTEQRLIQKNANLPVV